MTYLCTCMAGPDVMPFGAERQSLLLATLLDIMQSQSQPVSTIDLIGLEQVTTVPPPSGPPPASPSSNSRHVAICVT